MPWVLRLEWGEVGIGRGGFQIALEMLEINEARVKGPGVVRFGYGYTYWGADDF